MNKCYKYIKKYAMLLHILCLEKVLLKYVYILNEGFIGITTE